MEGDIRVSEFVRRVGGAPPVVAGQWGDGSIGRRIRGRLGVGAFLLPLPGSFSPTPRDLSKSFCFSWKQSDEVENGCPSFGSQLNPHCKLS